MLTTVFILVSALALLVRGATLSTKYAAQLGSSLHISKYVIGFIIVAVISILPETLVSINAALKGNASFGLATLLGSNVADLTLIFAIIILFTGKGLRVEGKVIKNRIVYPFLLLLPLMLGLDGYYTRVEGLVLIIAGGVFYYIALKSGMDGSTISVTKNIRERYISIALLGLSMALLLVGAYFTVQSATTLARELGVSPMLIGMLVVGLGTTMPELFFSLRSAQKDDDSLAVGDILGTVLADATVVVGILALVSPFAFPVRIIYSTGAFMLVASLLLFHFMRSGRIISKKEAYILLAFWLLFVAVEMTLYT